MKRNNDIQNRKDEHLDLAKSDMSQTSVERSSFDSVILTHQALPNFDFTSLDLTSSLWGRRFSLPLMIGAMTGGSDRGDRLNLALAEAAQLSGIPLALGSQRASLENAQSQKNIRALAPEAFIVSNIGIAQLSSENGLSLAKRAIDDVEANAIAIHLNPLQELIQPEGDVNWSDFLDALRSLIDWAPIPIVIKEVGAGLSIETVETLYSLGLRTFETAGRGGTNWAVIEQLRNDTKRQSRFSPFLNWGIPTVEAISTLDRARERLPDLYIIGSGGVRNGLDIARALRLGGNFAAAAHPFLSAGLDKSHNDAVKDICCLIEDWAHQLRMAMFLTNSPSLDMLRTCPMTRINHNEGDGPIEI